MIRFGLKIEAYKLIKAKLINGDILPGIRIREDILAEEFSMSRTPVREAINLLAAEGFVVQKPRKGIFAREFSKEELADIIKIRSLLESYAAKICCRYATDKQIRELNEIFINLKDSLINRNPEYILFDSMFHKKIGEITNNKKLSEYIDDLEDNVTLARRMKNYDIKLGYSEEESIKQHEAILNAIQKRDEESAFERARINTETLMDRMLY